MNLTDLRELHANAIRNIATMKRRLSIEELAAQGMANKIALEISEFKPGDIVIDAKGQKWLIESVVGHYKAYGKVPEVIVGAYMCRVIRKSDGEPGVNLYEKHSWDYEKFTKVEK